MSGMTSPARFKGDYDSFYESNFAADINMQMRVPKKIRVTGDSSDDEYNSMPDVAGFKDEKFRMNVPERIIVAGDEQHIGVKAIPREVELENAAMPPDPGMPRVHTPPRMITLDEHHFPVVGDEDHLRFMASERDYTSSGTLKLKHGAPNGHATLLEQEESMLRPASDSMSILDQSSGAIATTNEDLSLLRRQVNQLRQKVMSIELEQEGQLQRERILGTLLVTYFIIKSILWFTRPNNS